MSSLVIQKTCQEQIFFKNDYEESPASYVVRTKEIRSFKKDLKKQESMLKIISKSFSKPTFRILIVGSEDLTGIFNILIILLTRWFALC